MAAVALGSWAIAADPAIPSVTPDEALSRLKAGNERFANSELSAGYSAMGTVDAGGKRHWISTASVGGRAPNLSYLANKVLIAPEFLSNARALITSGTTLILTDAPVSARTQSAPGFNILTTQAK